MHRQTDRWTDRNKLITITLSYRRALMTQLYTMSDNEPLFVIPRGQQLVPLTDSVARKHLKDISHHLGLQKSVTFHDFRRAGASWAFQNGVPLEHIMKHGTWRSDAIWSYLSSSPSLESRFQGIQSCPTHLAPYLVLG